jgi:hypothetical protein
MGKKRKACRLLVGKPEGKRLLGRSKRRWIDNIKMDRQDIGWGGVDWICLAQDTYPEVEICCELGNEPSGYIKCWETTEWMYNL